MGWSENVDHTELQGLLSAHMPTIVVLTETKLIRDKEQRASIKAVFGKDYVLHYSSQSHSKKMQCYMQNNKDDRARSGCGGVAVAIHKKWAGACTIERRAYHNQACMKGHAVGLSLTLPTKETMEIVGAYMPADNSELDKRAQIYQGMLAHASHARWVIAAGDWNAGLKLGDRWSDELVIAYDRQHQQFVSNQLLQPLPTGPEGRVHTFCPLARDGNTSRIDDILVSTTLLDLAQQERVLETSDDSVHLPLLGVFDISSWGLHLPAPLPKRPRESRLKTPVPQQKLYQFKESVQINCEK